MVEEHVVAVAQGVQTGLSGIRLVETVFRTFTGAGEKIFAAAAFAGKRIALVDAELDLRGRRHHLPYA